MAIFLGSFFKAILYILSYFFMPFDLITKKILDFDLKLYEEPIIRHDFYIKTRIIISNKEKVIRPLQLPYPNKQSYIIPPYILDDFIIRAVYYSLKN